MTKTPTTTLKETAAKCCKKVYIGAAVLPKPLFIYDHDDAIETQPDEDPPQKINCATVHPVEAGDPHHSTPAEPTRYARTLLSEFNSLVVEHHLKWTPLVHSLPGPFHPEGATSDAAADPFPPPARLGKYDFHHVDALVDWALLQTPPMHVKGHVLVWHVTSPPFLEDLPPERVRSHLKRHVFTTVGHFRGRIRMWDVVNEALASDGTLVENVFYRKLGPGYVEECFRWAHEADPEAFLIYNDNKVEGCGTNDDDDDGDDDEKEAPNQAKSDGFYALLKSLVDKGVPIHGAGMQAHFNAGGVGKRQRCPTPAMVKRQIRRIGDLGLMVNISEMDVRVSTLPKGSVDVSYGGENDSNNNNNNNNNNSNNNNINDNNDNIGNVRTVAQTQIYRDILSAALSEPAFHGIWLWGFTDRHTWVKNFYYDDSPLIFDEQYNKKPSYYGVKKALETLCPGGTMGELTGGKKASCYLEKNVDDEGMKWGHLWMLPEPEEERAAIETTDTTKDGNPDWLQPS
ncbi:hypothetical protein ACHAXS_003855 [Conticribra weissflogii]